MELLCAGDAAKGRVNLDKVTIVGALRAHRVSHTPPNPLLHFMDGKSEAQNRKMTWLKKQLEHGRARARTQASASQLAAALLAGRRSGRRDGSTPGPRGQVQ